MAERQPVEKLEFQLSLCDAAASATRTCCAPWTKSRARSSSRAQSRGEALADTALPIACGQTISQPFVVAYMTEQLRRRSAASRARGRHRLRLPGGHSVATRARSGQLRTLPHARRCAPRRASGGSATATSRSSSATAESARTQHGTFDRIMVTAAVEDIPATLTDLLEPDGILIAPVGPHYAACRCCCACTQEPRQAWHGRS